MHHTGIILVLLLIVTFVCSQTSSNPNGAPFFSPSLVRELPLDTPVSSVILASPSDYADFYWGYIPENVGALTFTLNVTNSCGNSIQALMNFVTPRYDTTSSFPCDTGSYPCNNYDDNTLIAYADASETTSYYSVPFMRPGKNFYLTLYQVNTPTDNCSYTIQAQNSFNCSNGTTPLPYGGDLYCVGYSTETASGQSLSGLSYSTPQNTTTYRIDVPKNVSIVYAFVTSQDSTLYFMVSAGYSSYSWNYADDYTHSGVQLTSNSSLFRYYLQFRMPGGDYPLYYSVVSSLDGHTFDISFSWEYCGATKAGYGDSNVDYENATIAYNYPACDSTVQFTHMNIAETSSQNYTFRVPAYNETTGEDGASYGFLSVPFGTYGAVNISCYSNNSYQAFIVYSKNQNTDCGGGYLGYFQCTGYALHLLSQDLYSGGYWTFGACNYGTATDVVMMFDGSVTVPTSPTPVPSASTSPGSTAGATTGQDSSTVILVPAVILIMVVLAALIQY